MWCFDFVPIAPVSQRVLYVVIENEQVDVMNDIEITLPGDIAGLEDSNAMVRLAAWLIYTSRIHCGHGARNSKLLSCLFMTVQWIVEIFFFQIQQFAVPGFYSFCWNPEIHAPRLGRLCNHAERTDRRPLSE